MTPTVNVGTIGHVDHSAIGHEVTSVFFDEVDPIPNGLSAEGQEYAEAMAKLSPRMRLEVLKEALRQNKAMHPYHRERMKRWIKKSERQLKQVNAL
jgi:hypothetical protein